MTTVAAKTAGLTADVRGHSCDATHEKWREFSYANERQFGCFNALPSVTGSLNLK